MSHVIISNLRQVQRFLGKPFYSCDSWLGNGHSQPRDFVPSGDFSQCMPTILFVITVERMLQSSRGQRPGMVVSILHYGTRPLPPPYQTIQCNMQGSTDTEEVAWEMRSKPFRGGGVPYPVIPLAVRA